MLWLFLIVFLGLEGIVPLFIWMKFRGPRGSVSVAKKTYAKALDPVVRMSLFIHSHFLAAVFRGGILRASCLVFFEIN
jgi:hypothetical protein